MEPILRRFRNRFRKQLVALTDGLGKLFSRTTPQIRNLRSQRMCPFCGLITSRYKASCLECGKALKPA